VAAEIEQAVVRFATEQPALGRLRVANERKKKGFSPGGVRSIWVRPDLETFKKRLKALAAKVAQADGILTRRSAQSAEKGQRSATGQRRARDRTPRLSGGPRYVLCRHLMGATSKGTVIDT
jgi:hypothetical protein